MSTDSKNKSHLPGILTDTLYSELRVLARRHLRSERANHTLQPGDLVNEACLRILGSSVSVQSRSHLKALAAIQMRRILVNYERKRRKRIDGRLIRTTIPDLPDRKAATAFDVVELNEGLEHLAKLSERQARVLELRYFGGLTVAEAACELGVSERTIEADFAIGRAWLLRHLSS